MQPSVLEATLRDQDVLSADRVDKTMFIADAP